MTWQRGGRRIGDIANHCTLILCRKPDIDGPLPLSVSHDVLDHLEKFD